MSIWSAVGSIAGGLLGFESSRRTDNSNVEAQRAANAMNLKLHNRTIAHQMKQAAIDRRMQREFAKHGVGWKIEDAQAHGLAPEIAMGATTIYSPTGMPVNPPSVQPSHKQGQAEWLSKMGQGVGSAIDRFLTQDQRAAQNRSLMLDNRYKEIRNQAAYDDLNRQQTQAPVPFPSTESSNLPIAGQPDSNPAVIKPAEITVGKSRGKTYGTHHFGTDYVDDDGYLWEMPQKDIADVLESDSFSNVKRFIMQGGKYIKGIFVGGKKPTTPARKGYTWTYDRLAGMWREVPKGSHKGKHVYHDKDGRAYYRGTIYK
jgi:hypothetical protein